MRLGKSASLSLVGERIIFTFLLRMLVANVVEEAMVREWVGGEWGGGVADLTSCTRSRATDFVE